MKLNLYTESLPLETQRQLYLELRAKFENPPFSEPPLTGEDLLDTRLEEFPQIGTHLFNILKFAGIHTVRQLTETSPEFLGAHRGFGKVSLQQVCDFLEARGLRLKADL